VQGVLRYCGQAKTENRPADENQAALKESRDTSAFTVVLVGRFRNILSPASLVRSERRRKSDATEVVEEDKEPESSDVIEQRRRRKYTGVPSSERCDVEQGCHHSKPTITTISAKEKQSSSPICPNRIFCTFLGDGQLRIKLLVGRTHNITELDAAFSSSTDMFSGYLSFLELKKH